MFRLIGALLIIGVAGWGGLWVASTYSRRPQQLRSFQSALQMLDTEIVYGATPLPVALKKVGQAVEPAVGVVFQKAGKLLEKSCGYTAGEAWNKALGDQAGRTVLRSGDLMILKTFGEVLGASDRSEQHKNIVLTIHYLQKAESEAEKEKEKNGKLWRYGGFLIGISMVLLLL
ncbi:MAG: Stage III sporulation protein AB [Thermoanaerobacterales bacterium 50_218]|nr:MAG: Stage III sporulation protein AB [Thermoanaerobacterales bacterium 50_218]